MCLPPSGEISRGYAEPPERVEALMDPPARKNTLSLVTQARGG